MGASATTLYFYLRMVYTHVMTPEQALAALSRGGEGRGGTTALTGPPEPMESTLLWEEEDFEDEDDDEGIDICHTGTRTQSTHKTAPWLM